MKKFKNIAVIPARDGSKGVKHKNIKLLNGIPLIAYTIKAAIDSEIFDRVVVSTDSHEIANIAIQYGAEVPFLRPYEISTDQAPSDDVVLHALSFYSDTNENFDCVAKLQPTSPLRTWIHLKNAFQYMQDKQADSVVSVCKCEHTPIWTGQLDSDLRLDHFISKELLRGSRQQYPTYYRLNGAIYLAKADEFIKNRCFFGENGYAFIMESKESVDIDTEMDFIVAECILKSLEDKKNPINQSVMEEKIK